MIASLVNGEERGSLSILDRGLQFGDGLFETIAIHEGRPALWQRHMDRLLLGCRQLGFEAPDSGLLQEEARRLIGSRQSAILKILITRGCSERGYRIPGDAQPTRILELFEWGGPEDSTRAIDLRFCRQRLGLQPGYAGLKHLNRLEQVLARSEFDEGEGLMLDAEGSLVAGTASNLFLLIRGRLHTPIIDRCGVAGVVRALVLDVAREMRQPVAVRRVLPDELEQAEGIFLTSSLLGIMAANTVEGVRKQVRVSHHPVLEAAAGQVFSAG